MEDIRGSSGLYLPVWAGCPYPGLRPFRPDEAAIFFGRGREIASLRQRCCDANVRLVAVVGAAGTGKTSLIQAGLLPGLPDQLVIGCTPGALGDDPWLALAAAFAPWLEARAALPRPLARQISSQPECLNEWVGKVLAQSRTSTEVLLVIDQFEELFTVCRSEQSIAFIALLVRAMQIPGLRVLIGMRSEFVEHCQGLSRFAELLKAGLFALAPPGFGALYEIITRPAALAGLTFSDGLALQVLQDTGTEPGALPLLAVTLAELYRQRSPEQQLTQAAYERCGRVTQALDYTVEHVFARLPSTVQAGFDELFAKLLEMDADGRLICRYRPASGLARSDSARVLQDVLLGQGWLTRRRGEYGTELVGITQDALLYGWLRLETWLHERAADLRLLSELRQAVQLWRQAGMAPRLLWPHERLQAVQAMLKRLHPELGVTERAFLRSEHERLLAELEQAALSHSRRMQIGERLAAISDPRPGVGLDERGLPAIDWIPIPAGEVHLDGGHGTFSVAAFHIARYPLTWAQYRSFLTDPDGYNRPTWWRGLTEREDHPGQQRWPLTNQPADNIAWYDAVAFCRWLSDRLCYNVRLPTEWEWQQAATHGQPGRLYPWGMYWQEGCANTLESGLDRPVAVGLYPQGATPGGVMDMAGNIWEWCLNEYDPPTAVATTGGRRRVLRGGAWLFERTAAMTGYRDLDRPEVRADVIGVRLVCRIPRDGSD